MQTDKNFLATDPIGPLLRRLAIPTVTAQIINMLYNIVDLSLIHISLFPL